VSDDDLRMAKFALDGAFQVRNGGRTQSFTISVVTFAHDETANILRLGLALRARGASTSTPLTVELPPEVVLVDRPVNWGRFIRTQLRDWIRAGKLAAGHRVLQIPRPPRQS